MESVDLTALLRRLESGGPGVIDIVIPIVYDELKKLARGQLRREARASHLETTALVHEAFLKLSRGKHPSYENRGHFYGIVSRLMRQVLVDTARARFAEKRGAAREVALSEVGEQSEPPNRSLFALDDALRQLEKLDAFKAKLIELRYFAGMTAEETAVVLCQPVHVVRRELRLAQAWLRKEMAAGP